MKYRFIIILLSMLYISGCTECFQRYFYKGKNQLNSEIISNQISLDDILWWFPTDIETLIVSNGVFPIGPRIKHKLNVKQDLPSLQTILESSSYGLMVGLADHVSRDLLAVNEVTLAIEGSKKFSNPSGLGMMKYEGCHVIQFSSEIIEFMKSMEKNATQIKNIGEKQVLIFEKNVESDIWKIFYAQLRPNLILCATDEIFLTQMLNRISKRGKTRALPNSLLEWKYVDRTAQFWAIRHYEWAGIYDKKSKVYVIDKTRGPKHGEKGLAFGSTFHYDSKKPITAKVNSFSKSRNAEEEAKRFWSRGPNWSPGLYSDVRTVTPGVIEIVPNIDPPESVLGFWALLRHSLGHGVIL